MRLLVVVFALGLLLFQSSVVLAGTRVLLAVGATYGSPKTDGHGLETSPIVIRKDSDSWEIISLPDIGGDLRYVAFATPSSAWIAGTNAGGTILLHSDDAGLTWRDMSATLPDDLARQRIRSLFFQDEANGWILSETLAGVGPYLTVTRDGGKSWQLSRPKSLTVGSNLGLVRSGDAMALLESDGEGTRLTPLDSSMSSESGPEAAYFRAVSAAAVGNRVWVAGATALAADSLNDRPTIAFRGGSDAGWTMQNIDTTTSVELMSVSFSSQSDGVVGGFSLSDPSRPVIWATSDGGVTWRPGKFTETPIATRIVKALSVDGSLAWCVGLVDDAPGVELLSTHDGGASWNRDVSAIDAIGQIVDLASI